MEKLENLSLSSLSPVPNSKHRRRRVGFGEGSGVGKTCGKGNKGQKSRSGYKSLAGFEGGQMPLYRRLPKVGFTSRKKVLGKNVFTLVSLAKLEELADHAENGVVSIETFSKLGLIKSSAPRVKILGKEGLTKKLSVQAHAASAGAKQAIEAAGGSLEIVAEK